MEIVSRRSARIRFRKLAGVIKHLGSNPIVDSAFEPSGKWLAPEWYLPRF